MLGILLTIIAPIFSFAVGSAFPGMVFQNTSPVKSSFQGKCYVIEPNEKITLTQADIKQVQDPNRPSCSFLVGNYTRVKRGLNIIAGKIHDKDHRGGCESITWFGAKESNIRLVAKKDDKNIWWLDHNYETQYVGDFIMIEKDKKDRTNFFLAVDEEQEDKVFDVYAKDEVLNSMPEYVVNCKETGGLVPVVEGESGIRPPQVVPIKNIDYSLYKKNYADTVYKYNKSFPPFKNYLIKIDKQNLPTEALSDGQIGIYTTPLVKNERFSYDVFYHLGAFYLRDKAIGESYVYGTSADVPPQTIDQSPSLQLGRLWFRLVDSWTAFTPVCKPAIYLYPEKEEEVTVQLSPKGKITSLIPDFNINKGWKVKTSPDGKIEHRTNNIEQKTLSYLYYEAELDNGYNPEEGWIINRNNLDKELNVILSQLGLNEKEKKDFLDYWLSRLTTKPYYFIGLVRVEDVNNQEALVINPQPDKVIRIRIIFEGLDYPISVPMPKLETEKRDGFTVVDWGGSLIGETCEGKRIH